MGTLIAKEPTWEKRGQCLLLPSSNSMLVTVVVVVLNNVITLLFRLFANLILYTNNMRRC